MSRKSAKKEVILGYKKYFLPDFKVAKPFIPKLIH